MPLSLKYLSLQVIISIEKHFSFDQFPVKYKLFWNM